MKRAPKLPLNGLRIIVTRPDLQAGNLCLLLEARGAEAARLPMFAIEAIGDSEIFRPQFDAHRGDDGWIFTSANAARYAAEFDAGASWPNLYAIGNATAAALEAAGHPGAISAAQPSSSEALLALPALLDVQNKRYLIVTGEDGRELIASTLRARGASVDTLAVYRRVPVEHEMVRIEAEIALADAAVITSGETLDRLWALTPAALRPTLLKLALVVPGARVQERARELGFEVTLTPQAVSDESIVQCLLQWREQAAPAQSDAAPATPQAIVPGVENPAIERPHAAAATPARSNGVLAWLLVLILTGALGYGGWLFWDLRQNQISQLRIQDNMLHRLAQQNSELENQSEQTATRQSDLTRVMQHASEDLATMQNRLDNNQALLGRMTEELQGGRARFALASVEQLLLLANDRLLLEHDVRSALLALQLADERLGQLNDPRLFKVREAVAQERTQLLALPRVDLTSAALTLASLVDRADALPLKSQLQARQFGGGHALPAGDDADSGWMSRAWQSVRAALSSLFVIRRNDNASALRLLPAEDEAVIVHVLVLKLESARFALLRGETASFRDSLRSAADWLRQFFRADDPGVEAALGEIERLQTLELSAPPPDLSTSLTLLRAILEPAPQP